MPNTLFPPVVLAHGALGAWDEIIFIGVIVIFLVLMGVSWFRSRALQPDFDEPPAVGSRPAPMNSSEQTADDPDRFELE